MGKGINTVYVLTPIFIYTYTGELPSDHPEHPDSWHTIMGSSNPNPRLGALRSKLILKNAYKFQDFEQRRPLFTTKTGESLL